MFLRHVGKHGDRKVAVIFREIPNEPHMCLVTYTELLNQNAHDPMMNCIESDIGQSSDSLADALNRSYTKDGKIILQYLHAEGLLKKVNTELIVMTPTPTTKIKLNELNKILDEMKLGEDAVKRLSELDQSAGLQSPVDVARRMRNTLDTAQQTQSILGDDKLANDLRQQATKMSQEAKGLLAEADRLLKEAESLDPKPVTKPKTTRTKKTDKVTL
jgi:hypothetical protein